MENYVCFSCMMRVENGEVCPHCGCAAGAYTPAIYHLPPGTVLKERYLIGQVLGEGGFGITYIGLDLLLEMRVAIKEYFPTDKANRISRNSLSVSCPVGSAAERYEVGKRQFLKEALTLAKMDKQTVIVGVRDFFEENDTAYIVMEYVDGTTFKDLTERKGGRIPPAELLELMEPLFSVLSAMHNQGLIHRDISPENLMLENGEIRLLDFGCARESQNGDSTLTVTMKQGYAPVEQYQNKGQGPWTDVYALSATIYFCLTGIKPPQSVDRLVEDELVPPRKLGVKLTERQERAILHGMDVRPRRRFQTVSQLHDALYGSGKQAADFQQPEKDDQKSVPSKNRRAQAWKYACAASALILICLLAVWRFQPKAEPIEEPDGLMQTVPPVDTRTAGNDLATSEEALRAALADMEILTVTVPAGQTLDVTDGPLEIGKPVLIESGAELRTFQPVAVSGEGLIRVEGGWKYFAPVRAAGTGEVRVSSSGSMDGSALVWLDRADNLAVEKGVLTQLLRENAPEQLLILDEEAVFREAIHVTTLEEYDRCRQGNSPVVIDGDITLTDYNRCHTVPVLISEGVTVTAPVSGEGYCSWDVNGALLVNRGTILGRVVGGDWVDDGIDSPWNIINYGTIDGGFWSVADCGMMVNLGTLQGDGNSTGGFYNFGSFLPTDYQIRQGPMDNVGRITVGGSGQGRLAFDCIRSGVGNSGVLEIGEGGELFNYSAVQNYGRIAATASGAKLWNSGLLDVTASGVVDMHPSSTLGNSGVLQYDEDAVLNLPNDPMDSGRMVVLRRGDGEIRTVRTEEELRTALIDPACPQIAISDSAIAVTGDLTVTKGLTVSGPGSLAVSGGDLTVSGSNAFLLGNVDLGGGTLTLLHGAAVVGNPADCGGLTVQNAKSTLVTTGALYLNSGGSVELTDGGGFIALGSLTLEECGVSIGRWSTLRPCFGLWLESCEVEIGEDGELVPSGTGYRLDGGTTVVNRGFIREEEIWYNQSRELACVLTNYGWVELRGGVCVGGRLENHGTVQFSGDITLSGALNNLGRVYAVGGEMELGSGGTVTGYPVERRSDWTVPSLE